MPLDYSLKVVEGQWTSGLLCGFCCNDCAGCCEANCCPCYQVATQHTMVTRNTHHVDDLCLCMLCLDVGITAPLCLFTCCSATRTRSELRKKYGIDGTRCGDCCASFLCLPCALSQNHRELTYRGDWPGSLCQDPPVHFSPMGEDGDNISHAPSSIYGVEKDRSSTAHLEWPSGGGGNGNDGSPSMQRTRSQPQFFDSRQQK